jgi:LuxR family transcriptional regulator, regulator of acetate metabolism
VLVRLAELGPPSEVRRRAPAVVAEVLGLDRVLLTGVQHGTLVAEALHPAGPAADAVLKRLRTTATRVEYPLVESEILRRRRPRLVHADAEDEPARHAYGLALGWDEYAAAPIVLDGAVIGFLHAARAAPLDDADADALAAVATCFAVVYERAVLRHRLRVQRRELREIASWADARTSALGDRLVTLTVEAEPAEEAAAAQPSGGAGEAALRDLLTRRELDVMRLIVRGVTNADIARELVLSEGTVKFHVKNILRKMRAANRAEATSQYLRLTLNRT